MREYELIKGIEKGLRDAMETLYQKEEASGLTDDETK
jgi:hypothetical protein